MLILVAVVAAVTVALVAHDMGSPPPAPTDPALTHGPSAVWQPATVPAPVAASPGATGLDAEFVQLQAHLNATMGVAVAAVGGSGDEMTLGAWKIGKAWSTIKVPLAIAALNQQDEPDVTDAMKAAITESDNVSAESMWAGLGSGQTAEHKVEQVLQKYGDPTTVESQRVRPPFTPFGQTDWSLSDQAHFMSRAVCDKRNAPIFDLMGRVESDQRWGMGVIRGAQFKGGWGPDLSGNYLVRQIGVMPGPAGLIAVAVAAQPQSGSFTDGKDDLTAMAKWLESKVVVLPGGQCPA